MSHRLHRELLAKVWTHFFCGCEYRLVAIYCFLSAVQIAPALVAFQNLFIVSPMRHKLSYNWPQKAPRASQHTELRKKTWVHTARETKQGRSRDAGRICRVGAVATDSLTQPRHFAGQPRWRQKHEPVTPHREFSSIVKSILLIMY